MYIYNIEVCCNFVHDDSRFDSTEFSTGNTLFIYGGLLSGSNHLRAIRNSTVQFAGASTNPGFIVFE